MTVSTVQVIDANGVTQTVATLPILGQTSAASSLPVVLASGTVYPVSSNNVTYFTSSIAISGNAYSAGFCIGGLITLSGFTANTVYNVVYLRAQLSALPSNVCTFWTELFNVNPSSSTYTDNTAAVLVAGDITKRVAVVSAPELFPTTTQTTFPMWNFGTVADTTITTDSGGNIYAAVTTDTGFNAISSGHIYIQAALRQ